MSEIGHNSTNFSKDQLKAFVERIERLNEEKKAISDDIREVFTEAKDTGFDVKALRQVIKMRTWDRTKLQEHEAMVDLYRHALGDLADTPLGQSALQRATAN